MSDIEMFHILDLLEDSMCNYDRLMHSVLSFSGFSVREDGKVIHTTKETTLKGARNRAGALRSKLEDRGSHSEIFKYCRAKLLEENYFHAVLEAIKGVADRIRDLSGLTSDGAELVNTAFSIKTPVLAINKLSTETQRSEQEGFSNMIVGIFGAVRNPTAHAKDIMAHDRTRCIGHIRNGFLCSPEVG